MSKLPKINSNLTKSEAMAVRPFQALEQHGLACGYERSFKLTSGGVAANRYLLGVALNLISDKTLTEICQHLSMPRELFEGLLANKSSANLLLLGFDLNNDKPIYKVYLEFWDQILEQLSKGLSNDQAQLMHQGFKWECFEPTKTNITEYHYLPLHSQLEVNRQVSQSFDQITSECHQAAQSIIGKAYRSLASNQAESKFIFLQVSEAGNNRNSFDINLYPANLTVGDIEHHISELAKHLQINDESMSRLMNLTRNKTLGHISAGQGRDGHEYFCVYYEQ
ncbi:MAG: tryptophan halogenase [Cryomorphaceae bacterium]